MIQLVYQLRIDSVVANSIHFESFDPTWDENLEESILRMELSASWKLTRRDIFVSTSKVLANMPSFGKRNVCLSDQNRKLVGCYYNEIKMLI